MVERCLNQRKVSIEPVGSRSWSPLNSISLEPNIQYVTSASISYRRWPVYLSPPLHTAHLYCHLSKATIISHWNNGFPSGLPTLSSPEHATHEIWPPTALCPLHSVRPSDSLLRNRQWLFNELDNMGRKSKGPSSNSVKTSQFSHSTVLTLSYDIRRSEPWHTPSPTTHARPHLCCGYKGIPPHTHWAPSKLLPSCSCAYHAPSWSSRSLNELIYPLDIMHATPDCVFFSYNLLRRHRELLDSWFHIFTII